eukprot:218140-Alexandrium_andersonii.AAC.1
MSATVRRLPGLQICRLCSGQGSSRIHVSVGVLGLHQRPCLCPCLCRCLRVSVFAAKLARPLAVD